MSMNKSTRTSIPTPKSLGSEALAKLTAQPTFAWPTLALFMVAYLCWFASGWLGMTGQWPVVVSVAVSAVMAYWLFTVLHDASHRALSTHNRVNEVLGNLAMLPLLPLPLFKMFRYAHMQHHRFTNESMDKDPDTYTSSGPAWQLPLRWFTLDLSYFFFYIPRYKSRPKDEQRSFLLGMASGIALITVIVSLGYGEAFLLYWLLPSRFAVFFLALAFDYLPHMPKKATQQEDPFQATNNRVGHEWLLTPLLLWQNYHLVHHLYPRAPFYRYLKIWRCEESAFRARNPFLVDWKGKELADNEVGQ